MFQEVDGIPGEDIVGRQYVHRVAVADNGNQTVTDNLTALVWEKKANMDGTSNLGDPHDADNIYKWSTGSNNEDGSVFTSFLAALNSGAGLAGANGWRLPKITELQTIEVDFLCRGAGEGPHCYRPFAPSVDPALDLSNTQSSYYWSATSDVVYPDDAWDVGFFHGDISGPFKVLGDYAGAVRGGL